MTEETMAANRGQGRPEGAIYGKDALARDLATETGLPIATVRKVVNALRTVIVRQTAAGQNVTITGFGTFERRERTARQGMNPQTRQPIAIPASSALGFSPSAALKAAYNTGMPNTGGASYAAESAKRRGRTAKT